MRKKKLRKEIEQLQLTLAEEVKTNDELRLMNDQHEEDDYQKIRALRMIGRAAVVASALLAVRFIVSPRPLRIL